MTDTKHDRLFELAEAMLEVVPDGMDIGDVLMALMLASSVTLQQLHDPKERAAGLEISIRQLRHSIANHGRGMH